MEKGNILNETYADEGNKHGLSNWMAPFLSALPLVVELGKVTLRGSASSNFMASFLILANSVTVRLIFQVVLFEFIRPR